MINKSKHIPKLSPASAPAMYPVPAEAIVSSETAITPRIFNRTT